MKKFNCPNCKKEISVEELAKENLDIYEDLKKKAKSENEEVLRVQKEQLEKEFNSNKEQEISQLKKELELKIKKENESRELELSKKSDMKIEELTKLLEVRESEKSKEYKQRLEQEKQLQITKDKLEEERNKNDERLQLEKDKIEFKHQKEQAKIEKENEKLKEALEKDKIKNERDIKALQEKLESINHEKESQELKGEFGEEYIKNMISKNIPFDEVIDVKKGVSGADLIIKIKDTSSKKTIGKILVEVKNTKIWNNEWVTKFQNDLVKSGCQMGVIISRAQPKGERGQNHNFLSYTDNLFSCSFKETIPVILLLRQLVIETHELTKKQKNLSTEKDILYNKINSPEFKNKIVMIITRFNKMEDDLHKYERSTNRYFQAQKDNLTLLVKQMISMEESIKINDFDEKRIELEIPSLEAKTNDE